jgi:hypothetical protein
VQKHLKKVCDWLGPGYEDISTHSFRKYFGTEIYYKNGKAVPPPLRLVTWVLRTKRLNRH